MSTYQPPPNGFRTFVIVWITQSISVMGSALTYFAVTVWLAQTRFPGSGQQGELALAITAVSLGFALPNVFFAPLAGAFADRHDRKTIMMVADTLSGCLSLLLAALLLAGRLQVWTLVALVALFATIAAFHGSAFDASYVMLVRRELLPRANGMMQTMWALSNILSPAAAAAIIALPALARRGLVPGWLGAALGRLSSGAPLAIALDAVTFFAAAATLLFLFVPSPVRADLASARRAAEAARGPGEAKAPDAGPAAGPPRKSIWADVKEGALYVWDRRPLLWLLGTFALANLAGAPASVLPPLLLKFNLAADWSSRGFTFEAALALLTTTAAIGGVVGGLFISSWGGLKTRRVRGVLVPIIIAGLAQAAYGLSPLVFLTAAMGFCLSAMFPIMNAHSQAIWQAQVPPELQGRVFAVRRVIAQFTFPLGTAAAGSAAGVFGAGAVVAVAGTVLAAFCLGQLFNPYLLRVEDKVWLDNIAAARHTARASTGR